jgi:hypothetical protein
MRSSPNWTARSIAWLWRSAPPARSWAWRVACVQCFPGCALSPWMRSGRLFSAGIGSSIVPSLLNCAEIDEVVYVSDRESVQGCRTLVAAEGILAGGSSGSVIAAITRLQPSFPRPYRVLTILPDRGERYLDLVYDDDWVAHLPGQAMPVVVEPVVQPLSALDAQSS